MRQLAVAASSNDLDEVQRIRSRVYLKEEKDYEDYMILAYSAVRLGMEIDAAEETASAWAARIHEELAIAARLPAKAGTVDGDQELGQSSALALLELIRQTLKVLILYPLAEVDQPETFVIYLMRHLASLIGEYECVSPSITALLSERGLVDVVLRHSALPAGPLTATILGKYALIATEDPAERELVEAWRTRNMSRWEAYWGVYQPPCDP
jgi:hypothetical protein